VARFAESIVEPNRLKRIKAGEPASGIPFFGTSALMWSEPTKIYSIARREAYTEQYLVNEKMLLVPRSGQLSGIIGRVVLPHGDVLQG
jgi:type I restriction enzyme S subunit